MHVPKLYIDSRLMKRCFKSYRIIHHKDWKYEYHQNSKTSTGDIITNQNFLRSKVKVVAYCKRGHFRWGKISQKCWQDFSRGVIFTLLLPPISFIKAYGFYFHVGVIFAKTKAQKRENYPHAKISTFTVVPLERSIWKINCKIWMNKPAHFRVKIIICPNGTNNPPPPPQQQPLGHGQKFCEVSCPSKLPVKDNGLETNFCNV